MSAISRVVGISMCKDEADVIEATVRHLAAEVDELIVADNRSGDGTREILAALAEDLPLTVLDDPDPAYFQSAKMSRLAALAADTGADWVVPFDADELWYSPFGRIADVLAEHPGTAIFTADLYDHVATGKDPAQGTVPERMGWRRRKPAPLQKVAVAPRPAVTIEQGNHGAHYGAHRGATLPGLLVVRHYPYRSPEQMIRKARNGAAAYAATDLPETDGQHWRDYGRLSDEQLADVFRTWFWVADPAQDESLIFDPVPACVSAPS